MLGPQFGQGSLGGQAHFQAFVARQRNAALEMLREGGGRLRTVVSVLARANQLDLVIADLQAIDNAAKRHRHTVHFGRVGFGHHGDAQLGAHRGQGLAGEIGSVHARSLRALCDRPMKRM